MSTLEFRLQDPDYKNWVKSGLCLALVKEGLEEYAEIKSNEFHDAVLASVAKLKTYQTSVCEGISFNNNQGKITCNHTFCQGFLDAIVSEGIDTNQKFTIRKSNIDNCNVKLWHTDPWELAKLFMNTGQKPNQKMPSQTDLSGILNFLDHNDIARKGIHKIQHIDEVRKARNSVMHTSDMKVSPDDFESFKQSVVNLLSDSKFLGQLPSAQKAVSDIQGVAAADFHITKENEYKILQEWVNYLRTQVDNVQTELNRVETNVGQKLKAQQDELEKELKDRDKDKQRLEKSLQTLEQKIKGDVELVRTLGTEVNTIKTSLHKIRQDIDKLTSRMEKVEREHEQLKRKQANMAAEQADMKQKFKEMETPSITEQDCRKLREDLVEEYSRIYKDISLSPFGDGLNDDALRVPIDKIYCDLDIVKIKGNKQPELESENGSDSKLFADPFSADLMNLSDSEYAEPLTPRADRGRKKTYSCRLESYSEMFSDKGIKNIVIKGEGGTGKSTWCKRLLHAWCQVQRRALGMKGAKSGDEENSDMEESLKRFDNLLYVTLRQVKEQLPLKDIVFNAGLERLSVQRNVLEFILAKYSENVLILLDGFDEYPFTLDCQGLGQSTIVMTTRPWKYDVLRRYDSTFKVDAESEIRGLTHQGVWELSKNIIASYNMGSDRSIEEQTRMFLGDIKSAELSNSIEIPLILIITVLTWLENKSLSKSLTYNILNHLKVIFQRGENKLSETDKAVLKELEKNPTPVFPGCLTAKYSFMRDNQVLFQKLGRLAYKGLTDQKKGLSLVFKEVELHEFLASDELEICCKLGLLTKSAVTTSILEPPQVSISFYHKLIQELFAAISIISDSDSTLSEFTKILASLTAVLEMENVILFITGLNPSIGSDLSKHFVGLADTDALVCRYRTEVSYFDLQDRSGNRAATLNKLLFKCMLEWDIVHEGKEQKRLCLTDLIIDSDCDNKLRLCAYHNREHLKSLSVRVSRSESVNIIPILSQLTTITSAATALQSLYINVGEVRCESINTIDTTHFDLTSNVHLESISIKGIQLSNGQHFLSVTFGKTMQLRRVTIEHAVINTLYPQNNTELKLKDVKISEIRLPTRLEQLKYVRLESVTMPGLSWNSFFQSLQSASLTKLKLKNLHINDITIILENCPGLKWLVLEDVKVSEIRLPTRLELLEVVILQSVTMPGSSWTSFFQSLQSPSLTWLILKNLHINDITIILETCSGLHWLELEDVKVSEIRLPTRLEQLKNVILQSVTMPRPSWNSFFQSLQSPSLITLILKNPNIDDIFIRLFNCEELGKIEISNVKLAGIDISSTERLGTVKVDEVVFPESQASSFFNQVLQSTALVQLTMKNISLGEERVRFDSWHCEEIAQIKGWRRWLEEQPNIQIQLENVSMSQESYGCLCTVLKTLKCSENEGTKHSIEKGLLNVTVVKKVNF